MATVTISRSDGGSGPVPKGTGFTLQARVSGGRETAWKWKLNDQLLPDEASSDLKRDASDDTVGNYVAIATVNGEEVESTAFPVELGDAPTTEPKPEPAPEVPPEYHPRFARVTAIFAFVLGVIVLWSPASAAWHVGKSDWKGTDGHLQLAATLGVPLTVLGGAAVVVGAWMAAVEWRGRFRKPPEKEEEKKEEARARGVEVDIPQTITAIGKLKGAALVMVVGAALMLGSAWIAKESADQPTPATTTNEGTTPTPPPPPAPQPPGSGGGG